MVGTMTQLFHRRRPALPALAVLCVLHGNLALAETADLTELSFESLSTLQVSTASRFLQSVREAPSAVQVIRREDIRRHGWQTLTEALSSLPGFYPLNDGAYDFPGTRGFLIPGDYNTRFLLLVDGQRINDNIYQQALMGEDFPIDLMLVERIEYVPGPGSSIYGGNAIFGVVNVILRNFQRQRESLERLAFNVPEARWNFPGWWLKRLPAEHPTQWEAIVTSQNNRPPMTLRVNQRLIPRADYAAQLDAAGLQYRVPAADPAGVALILDTPVPVSELPGFAAGQVSVQDLGAQWAAPLLDVATGMRVLDACAAPGGKTSHLLESADLDLWALDSDAGRLQQVSGNLDRLALRELPSVKVRLLAEDAGKPSAWWDDHPFDRILLDAPCTASGVVRRHPDGKWLKRAEDMQHLAREQSRLLDALWPLLKSGGKMLYATCSLFQLENSDQVTAFLARHADARIEPVGFTGQNNDPLTPTALLPDADMDGFFYARLLKT